MSIAWRQEKPDLKVKHMSVAKKAFQPWNIKKLLFPADYLGVIQIHQSPDEIFLQAYKIKTVLSTACANGFKILVWIFKEKNKYKVTTCFF